MTASDGPGSTRGVQSQRHVLLRRGFWAVGGGSLIVLVAVMLFAVTWFYSGEIQSGAFEVNHDPPEFNIEVAAIDSSTITLVRVESDLKLDEPGILGVRSESAYVSVRDILKQSDGRIVRRYDPVEGELSVGDRVKYERSAFPGDPFRAFGIEFSDVQYQSPLGSMPAWFVPGMADTWAILVHGRSADRTETLRCLSIAYEAGMPVMSISYRNDEGVAADPSGEHGFGITEWEDLHGAVEYALANGAEQVVLFGFSMGGGVIAHFMIESSLADRVSGLVLDAPMLNLTNALDLAARRRGVPEPIPSLAAVLSSMRFDVDWSLLDVRDEMLGLELPILLFHGTADRTIPVSQSDEFAERSGANVTYVRVGNAEHVGAWNVDSNKYRTATLAWLDEVVGGLTLPAIPGRGRP